MREWLRRERGWRSRDDDDGSGNGSSSSYSSVARARDGQRTVTTAVDHRGRQMGAGTALGPSLRAKVKRGAFHNSILKSAFSSKKLLLSFALIWASQQSRVIVNALSHWLAAVKETLVHQLEVVLPKVG